MAGGASPQTTSCSSQGEWSGTLGLGWDWRSGAGPTASHNLSFPLLSSHIPSIRGLSGRCWGNQGAHLAVRASCLEIWGAQAGKECHSRGRAANCLKLSPFLALSLSDLRVLGILLSSVLLLSSSSPMGGERVFLVELGFQSTWHIHFTSQVAISLFRMQYGISFG